MLNTSDIGSNMAVRRNKMIGFDPLRCDISGYTTKGFFNIFELFSISVVKCYYASKWNKFSSTLTIIVDPYYSGHDTLNRVGHFTLGQFERDNFLQSWNDSFFYSFPLSLFFFFKFRIIPWFRLTIFTRLYNINMDIIYHIFIICHVFTFTNIYFLFFL